jgi:hypothetical protein
LRVTRISRLCASLGGRIGPCSKLIRHAYSSVTAVLPT